MWKKGGVFYKLLLSYVCMLIPLLILCLIMVSNMRAARMAENRQMLQAKLRYVAGEMDSLHGRYRNSAVLLANEPSLLRAKMLSSEAEV